MRTKLALIESSDIIRADQLDRYILGFEKSVQSYDEAIPEAKELFKKNPYFSESTLFS